MSSKSNASSRQSSPSSKSGKSSPSSRSSVSSPSESELTVWGLTGAAKEKNGKPSKEKGVFRPNKEDEDLNKPDFIYGGPFLPKRKVDGFLNTATPYNMQLSGVYKQSHAYDSLKDILPIVLTKIIDEASKSSRTPLVEHIAKLKSDLVTNKKFSEFEPASADCDKWNQWIQQLDIANEKHFLNVWSWTESYVYRKVYEGVEINNMHDYDYFANQKSMSLSSCLEPMCVIAEKLLGDLCTQKEERKAMKEDFASLIKVSMWASRYNMPLTQGKEQDLSTNIPNPILPLPKPGKPPKKPKKGKPEPVAPPLTDLGYLDPFQVNLDLKANTLLDDSMKALDLVDKRAKKLATQREKFETKALSPPSEEGGEPVFDDDIILKGDGTKKKKEKKPKPPPPDPNAEKPARIVCPAKRTAPDVIYMDIVTNNAGYELFTDFCLAHYVICQNIVEKVRFRVKKYPWQVLDATKQDVDQMLSVIKSASFNKTSNPPPPTKPTEEPREPRNISANALNQLGNAWQSYIDDGTFIICADDYWTYPWTYPEMKKYDLFLYKELQFSAMIVWKGDFNFRKLLADRNCPPTEKIANAILGFIPAPHLLVRTIKSEILCGLKPGRKEQLIQLFGERFFTTGDFGTIQISKKADKVPKKPDGPCLHYADTCFDAVCPLEPQLVPRNPPEEAPLT